MQRSRRVPCRRELLDGSRQGLLQIVDNQVPHRLRIQAWLYWRSCIKRVVTQPTTAVYTLLGLLVQWFGASRTDLCTTTVDSQLHAAGAAQGLQMQQLNGSLRCSDPCCSELHRLDANLLKQLEKDPSGLPECPSELPECPSWLPECPCCHACLQLNLLLETSRYCQPSIWYLKLASAAPCGPRTTSQPD